MFGDVRHEHERLLTLSAVVDDKLRGGLRRERERFRGEAGSPKNVCPCIAEWHALQRAVGPCCRTIEEGMETNRE